MLKLFHTLFSVWRKPTLIELAQHELEAAKKTLFRSETLLVYHQSQVESSRRLIPLLERKIAEFRQERKDA